MFIELNKINNPKASGVGLGDFYKPSNATLQKPMFLKQTIEFKN